MTESQHGLPVFRPDDVIWFGATAEPIIGRKAEEDLRIIRSRHSAFQGLRLAKKLVKHIRDLLDQPVSINSVRIADPPGVGPRYACDLCAGYAAVCWLLEPSAEQERATAAIWVERVMLWSTLMEALNAIASVADDD